MLKEKIMQIFYNKHGNDQLNMFLVVVSFILVIINIFVGSRVLYSLYMICFVLYFLRFFSSNHFARSKENDKFLQIIDKLHLNRKSRDYNTVNTNFNYSKPKKQAGYKYFKCPTCSVKLRVPKKKGKITITCPKCRNSFKGKS